MSVWQELESIASIIKHDGEVDLDRVRSVCRRAQDVVAIVDAIRAGTVTIFYDDDGVRRMNVTIDADPSTLATLFGDDE